MDLNIRNQIRLFCKNNCTVGIPVDQLYYRYKANPRYTSVTQFEFEMALKILNKNVMLDLERDALRFINKNQDLNIDQAYKKFAGKVQSITREMWGFLFKDYYSAKSPEIKKVQEIHDQEKSEPVSFKDLLPVNWPTMTLPERIDFVKKIDHKDFQEYVLSLDTHLSKYYKTIKKDIVKLKLYVTLFSFPSNTTSEEAKQLLKSFVESLNQLGRARLQYMECTDPPSIEIREIRS